MAQPLWKEMPRFNNFRRHRIELWHECKDLDLAVWVDRLNALNLLRNARIMALKRMFGEHPDMMGVPQDRAEVFLLQPGTNCYLGVLCIYASCPKDGKRSCRVKGCGSSKFLQAYEDFALSADAVTPERSIPLYTKGQPLLLPVPGTKLDKEKIVHERSESRFMGGCPS